MYLYRLQLHHVNNLKNRTQKKAVAFRKMCRVNEPLCTIEFLQSTGDEVQVVYTAGTDNTPVRENASEYYNGFTGFRF